MYTRIMTVCLTLFLISCDRDSTSIHKWDGLLGAEGPYVYIIRNPPKTQSGMVDLISNYLRDDSNTPDKFLDGTYGISFYEESSDTPIDGDRPKASWWEQPMTGPAILYREIDDHEVAAARYFKDKGILRIFLQREYRQICPTRDTGIVDILPDGNPTRPLCN